MTDSPHADEDQPETYQCNLFGVNCGSKQLEHVAQLGWSGHHSPTAAESDPTDPARWTEIHPPDLIGRLDPVQKQVTVREVAALSSNCLLGTCASTTIDTDIYPPVPRPNPTSQLIADEIVGHGPHETIDQTLEDIDPLGSGGAQITRLPASNPDHVHIHIRVRGWSGERYWGKFKATYLVYWLH